MDYSQFLLMHHEIGLLIVFVLVFLFDTFGCKKAQDTLSVTTLVLFGAFTIYCFCAPMTNGEAFAGMYATSPIVASIKNILNIGLFIVLLQSIKWNNSESQIVRRGEFMELMLVTLFGMYLMVSARHFLVFVIGLETASLPLAALAAFDKKQYESHEAAVKYLFTAIFSSAIYMLGLSFVYGFTGSLYFSDIAASCITVMADGSFLLYVALAFVVAGIGFKISLVPFHLWTADVYQGAPTSVTSYLSVVSKGAAAFAAFVVLTQAFGAVYSQVWEWMLYALIILTITLGNLFAIRQTNMKRFLAFSSISQAGYIMLGVIACNATGVAALSYYVLVYVVSNLAAFGVIQAIENATGKVDMTYYNGLYKTNPKLSFAMMLAMFSLGGIPPFAGFFSKFFIFSSALEGGSVAIYVLVFIALLNTIISLYYYLLVVKAMFINPNDNPIATFKSHWSERAGLVICVAGIILIGLASCIYTALNHMSANSLF